MKKTIWIYIILLALALWPIPRIVYGSEFKDILQNDLVAVEMQERQKESYSFGNLIGSLHADFSENIIYITELGLAGDKNAVFFRRLHLKNVNLSDTSMTFDCVDELGPVWRGRIWMRDSNTPPDIGVEIVSENSLQRITNLSRWGLKFIEERNLSHVNLGRGHKH